MAKRRQLETPTQDQLREIEEGFARETRRDPLGLAAPIATVAAEAAALTQTATTDERAEQARDRKDAARLRDAEARGLLVRDIALSDIVADEMVRDRMSLDPEEMAELKASIRSHGLRLPIEIFELAVPQGEQRYGLISGYRRLGAVRALLAETGREEYLTIRALVRKAEGSAEAFVAMVEENEIRAGLSQYERGRVAVVAAENGAFETVEAAVDALFASGSKAKRSKLRSFALIHEELGDLLKFPQALSERQGLRLATALRAGMAERLRAALSSDAIESAEDEWRSIEPIAVIAETGGRDNARGGRPRQVSSGTAVAVAQGVHLQHKRDSQGLLIRLTGSDLDRDLMDRVLTAVERVLRGEA
ncbi:ParB/RepB/Spo0J family partition protein [Paracoccus laeviglucosivorans]|uniref:Chromosome partitioning protein, ParB family n=1 Tax=Paracoccus laeviglucosivorans TaxID=1197861 RepID=A0A521EBE8_9RHOB|nr:ParB N-terminal domain-containing protein [Paracoccus laeviglucosivorans]SMO81266.1 chromosome partitioning protein, ParB family [Paracoccus laeviglucosivorans]